MRLIRLIVILTLLSSVAVACTTLTVERIEAGGKLLNASEVRALVTNAGVTRTFSNGTRHHWTSKEDGTMSGLHSGMEGIADAVSGIDGTGSWRIDKEGRWCTTTQWTGPKIRHCMRVFSVSGSYYAVDRKNRVSTLSFVLPNVGKMP